MRILLIGIFGFADQGKVISGLGCHLTLKRDKNDDIVLKERGTAAAIVSIEDIACFDGKITLYLVIQQINGDHMLSEIPTELYYEKCTVF